LTTAPFPASRRTAQTADATARAQRADGAEFVAHISIDGGLWTAVSATQCPGPSVAGNRAEINQLLMDKLSDALDDKQKSNKISSLLTRLRRRGMIVNTGSDTAPCWRLTERIAKRN